MKLDFPDYRFVEQPLAYGSTKLILSADPKTPGLFEFSIVDEHGDLSGPVVLDLQLLELLKDNLDKIIPIVQAYLD